VQMLQHYIWPNPSLLQPFLSSSLIFSLSLSRTHLELGGEEEKLGEEGGFGGFGGSRSSPTRRILVRLELEVSFVRFSSRVWILVKRFGALCSLEVLEALLSHEHHGTHESSRCSHGESLEMMFGALGLVPKV